MTSVAPCPPAYDDQPQPFQQPSGGPYDPPPAYYGQRPSEGYYQYPPRASYPSGYPPGNYGYPPAPQQQQQQQSVVIVNAGVQRSAVEYYVPYMSFGSHKFVACISIWFCGVIFGLIGFILAVVAESSASAGDISTARCLGNASMSISVIGMVIFVFVIAITFGAGY